MAGCSSRDFWRWCLPCQPVTGAVPAERPFILHPWLPQRGLCVTAAPAQPPDPLSCPSGRSDGNVSAATHPACSKGGRLCWRLQTLLAAAIPSAPHLFQPLLMRCRQPSLPVLHGIRQLFTALYNFSCWAWILSKTNHHVNSILTQQQPTQCKWNGNDIKAAPSKLGWWSQLHPVKGSLQTKLWLPFHSGVSFSCFCKLDQIEGCRSLWTLIRAARRGNDWYEISLIMIDKK